MKIISLIIKSLKEQLRSIWLLLLLLSMGPFFVLVYSLITRSSDSTYRVIVINRDLGMIREKGDTVNYGKELIDYYGIAKQMLGSLPFDIEEESDRKLAVDRVMNNKADAVIVIDSAFSNALIDLQHEENVAPPGVEFIGDLSNVKYMITATWMNEIITEFALYITGKKRPVVVRETALGSSGNVDEFNFAVPGILIIAVIMLMFTASIAFVSEIEHGTMLRLRLSKLTTIEFLIGIGFVQLLIGILAAFLTLFTAVPLGFEHAGAYLNVMVIVVLTSLSIIAFSLIVAAVTKSAREILIVGNFPMFLFMFFTGAAFPINNKPLFHIADYPVNIQGLMSPTHATAALKKILIMKMDLGSVAPEIIAILILTAIYFLIGGVLFRRRHIRPST